MADRKKVKVKWSNGHESEIWDDIAKIYAKCGKLKILSGSAKKEPGPKGDDEK